jgi:hypothetical protein
MGYKKADLPRQKAVESKKKVRKGTRRMPRLSEAMKEVISCYKLRGLANTN